MATEYSKEEILNNETEESAALEAASDVTAQNEADKAKGKNETFPYTVLLSKTYDLDGKKISEIDLSGLEDLTTADGEYIERVMAKLNHTPTNKFMDLTYTKHIAMKVTGLPIEFFNALKWKDQQRITSRIAVYFLYY